MRSGFGERVLCVRGADLIGEPPPCVIPGFARFLFAVERRDEFLEAAALSCKMRVGAVMAHITDVVPQGLRHGRPIGRDGKHPDFLAVVLDLVPHVRLRNGR